MLSIAWVIRSWHISLDISIDGDSFSPSGTRIARDAYPPRYFSRKLRRSPSCRFVRYGGASSSDQPSLNYQEMKLSYMLCCLQMGINSLQVVSSLLCIRGYKSRFDLGSYQTLGHYLMTSAMSGDAWMLVEFPVEDCYAFLMTVVLLLRISRINKCGSNVTNPYPGHVF